MRYTKEDKQEAFEYLHKLLKPGDTVYTKLEHVSRSGMLRVICPIVMRNNSPIYPIHSVAVLLDLPRDKRLDGIRIGGCGMDMGFHLVYELSYKLFPNGWHCIGKKCNNQDHYGENKKPYTKNTVHTSGGYALKQKWL